MAQQAVAEKSNESTAIPDLLGLLDLRGAMVSMDAMGGQKAIAQTVWFPFHMIIGMQTMRKFTARAEYACT